MKNTKKILSVATVALVLPVLAFALEDIEEPSGAFTEFGSVFTKILSLIWPIVGGLAAVMLVVAALIFITANGSAEKISQARMAMLWAVIGIAAAILAYSIPAIISTAIGG